MASAVACGGGATSGESAVTSAGRRPQGVPETDGLPTDRAGAYFAAMARLEEASVHAFRVLRRELAAHGAPKRLVRAAERAARDETRHAALAFSIDAWVRGRLDRAARGRVEREKAAALAELEVAPPVDPALRVEVGLPPDAEWRTLALAMSRAVARGGTAQA